MTKRDIMIIVGPNIELSNKILKMQLTFEKNGHIVHLIGDGKRNLLETDISTGFKKVMNDVSIIMVVHGGRWFTSRKAIDENKKYRDIYEKHKVSFAALHQSEKLCIKKIKSSRQEYEQLPKNSKKAFQIGERIKSLLIELKAAQKKIHNWLKVYATNHANAHILKENTLEKSLRLTTSKTKPITAKKFSSLIQKHLHNKKVGIFFNVCYGTFAAEDNKLFPNIDMVTFGEKNMVTYMRFIDRFSNTISSDYKQYKTINMETIFLDVVCEYKSNIHEKLERYPRLKKNGKIFKSEDYMTFNKEFTAKQKMVILEKLGGFSTPSQLKWPEIITQISQTKTRKDLSGDLFGPSMAIGYILSQ